MQEDCRKAKPLTHSLSTMPAPTALKNAEDAPPAVDVSLPVEENDEEFLLDAPDALPTDVNVLVPVEESNENGMAIDEEGRPRFAPARDIDPVTRVETRKIPIPPHRMTPFKTVMDFYLPSSGRAPQATMSNEHQAKDSRAAIIEAYH